MNLVTPQIGLIFWTAVTFLILLVLLKKFAWGPIVNALKEREENIDSALKAAENAKKELQDLQSNNEELLAQARAERDEILKLARQSRDSIVNEAKERAEKESGILLANAVKNIEIEKQKAITELRNQVGILSLEIAEKLVKERLSDDTKQKELVDKLIGEVNFN
jgi:F-type H+-transporting ATPase subunit b